MNFQNLFDIFQNLGSVVGILITFATFWGLISKKPKAALRNLIREEAKAANQELEDNVKSVSEKLESNERTTVAMIRHEITETYYKYKDNKKLPSNVKEDILSLYERYERLGGNSFVHSLIDEMKTWEIE